uniref:peptidylprolyl isomerase n=2 Tax=Haplochromini TaxID=319058 RepID=A0A3Q2VUK1_HAPBU
MLLVVLSWLCSFMLVSVSSGGKLPEAEVTIEVLHRPFLCHRKSKYGDILLVHHDGYFENGTMFFSSRVSGDKQPIWFTLGIREAIKGWDKGLQNMCSGEKRKLVIPPELAYGKEGKGMNSFNVSE